MTKPTPEAVALKVARALSGKGRFLGDDDYCGFAHAVGEELHRLGDDGFNFGSHYLALGILYAEHRREEELDAEELAADDPKRERRERMRELIRLVTLDGKPVEPEGKR